MTAIPLANTGKAVGGEAPAQGSIGAIPYIVILLQLGLLTLLLRQFQIESAAFLRLALLAFGGFALHALLPMRYRLPFFLGLSLVGIVLVLDVANGLSIIAIGLVLIGICHLPVSFRLRGVLLVLVGALLVALRAKWVDGPVSDAVWPILGSMFMFRLIVYFYDLRHDTAPVSPVRTLAYFFMLPNACFPLFPVVDYKAFRRNYYDDDAYRTYQVGVDWMVRGVIHLILYRFVYYHVTLAPSEVAGPAQLLQYLVANFALYLRVSGLFHLIVGMLYLFGFRLPETHNQYFLASSFTDFWRRINIYWKDFMQRIFYYPMVFRLRKLGTTKAMVVSTLFVFAMTWLLHAYQWFWLRGTLLLVWQDVLFWVILGGIVVANALYELKHGRDRSLGRSPKSWRSFAMLTVKTFATFWIICALWSFWTAESISDWLSLWAALGGKYTLDVLLFPAIVLTVIVVGNIEHNPLRNRRASEVESSAWLRARLVTVASLVALVGVSIEEVHQHFGTELATTIHTLRSGHLSRLDTVKLERGYYENLLSVDRFNSQLWEVYAKKPQNWLDVQGAGLKHFTGGFAQTELIPSFVSRTPYGTVSINRWGMRDKDYERTPPANTYRVALLGASSVMGWGVGDGETFEALLEDRFNKENGNLPYAKYEILNFGVPGYQPPQQLVALDRALSFAPNAVFYVATGREVARASSYMVEVVQKKIEIPYEPLRELVNRAGLEPSMAEATALKQLAPFRSELLSWTYKRIADRARSAGAFPLFIFLPQVREESGQEETAEILKAADAAGFVVINLAGVFKGEDSAALRIAEWDQHPNRRGHQLVASRLYDELQKMQPNVFNARDRTPTN
jgi:D-alanyl-lipoteichoic acid acyltransferase DltB (MBOAT superfamily)